MEMEKWKSGNYVFGIRLNKELLNLRLLIYVVNIIAKNSIKYLFQKEKKLTLVSKVILLNKIPNGNYL